MPCDYCCREYRSDYLRKHVDICKRKLEFETPPPPSCSPSMAEIGPSVKHEDKSARERDLAARFDRTHGLERGDPDYHRRRRYAGINWLDRIESEDRARSTKPQHVCWCRKSVPQKYHYLLRKAQAKGLWDEYYDAYDALVTGDFDLDVGDRYSYCWCKRNWNYGDRRDRRKRPSAERYLEREYELHNPDIAPTTDPPPVAVVTPLSN